MAGLTEIATEEVAEAAEAVAEAARETPVGQVRLAVTGILIGFGVGFATGWFSADRRLRTKYERAAEEEILQMREHYRAKEVVREKKPALDNVVVEAGYATPATPPTAPAKAPTVDPEPETKNVFGEAVDEEVVQPDWDYAAEIATRSPDKPYVIHEDEQHEKDYNTTTLTYFEGDDVLSDVEDKIIDNKHELVGDCINRFGHGCSDPNVVFVRNEKLELDIELCRSTGTYAEEVHGFQHADEPFQWRPARRDRHDE